MVSFELWKVELNVVLSQWVCTIVVGQIQTQYGYRFIECIDKMMHRTLSQWDGPVLKGGNSLISGPGITLCWCFFWHAFSETCEPFSKNYMNLALLASWNVTGDSKKK